MSANWNGSVRAVLALNSSPGLNETVRPSHGEAPSRVASSATLYAAAAIDRTLRPQNTQGNAAGCPKLNTDATHE